MLELIIFSLLNGIVYGLLLFMLSSGMTLIFGMMGILNLAHGAFYMAGAYVAYQISLWIGFWPALVLAPLIIGALGASVERYGLTVAHAKGHAAELLFTLGLLMFSGELIQMIWGRLPVRYKVPEILDFTLFSIWGTNYPAYRIFMIVISVGMLFILYITLKRTRIGLIIQASLTHSEMVGMLGHNVQWVFILTFGVGCALAGLAGVIGGNVLTTDPGMAETVGSIVFAVVVIGGLGSLVGAFFASILIGLIQTLAITINYSLADLLVLFNVKVKTEIASITVAQIAPLLPFLILVLMMVFRPKGLMGVRET